MFEEKAEEVNLKMTLIGEMEDEVQTSTVLVKEEIPTPTMKNDYYKVRN